MSRLLALGFVGLMCGFTFCFFEPGVEANQVSTSDNRKTCGTIQYHVYEAVCCDQNLLPVAGKACCGTKGYDPQTDTCCNANISAGLSEEVSSCCGEMAYDPLNQICCGSKLHNKPSALASCCGEAAYDKETQLCCGSKRVIKNKDSNSTLCCGHETYDTNTHCCYMNRTTYKMKVINISSDFCQKQEKRNQSKTHEDHIQPNINQSGIPVQTQYSFCNSSGKYVAVVTLYNPQTHICCGGRVPERNPQKNQCCGTKLYSLAQRGVLCCNNVLYEGRDDAEECSELGTPYHPEKGTLCCGMYHIKPGKHCCGQHVYEPHTQICCNGHVHIKKPNVHCCGINMYNIHNKKCCSGSVYDLDAKCCGSTQLTRTDQVCCSSTEKQLLYTSKTNFACCGHHYFNTSLWSCCAGRLRPGPQKENQEMRLVSMSSLKKHELCKEMHIGSVKSMNQTHTVFDNVLKIHRGNSKVEAVAEYVMPTNCSFPKLIRGKFYFFDGVQVFIDFNHDLFLHSLYFFFKKCFA